MRSRAPALLLVGLAVLTACGGDPASDEVAVDGGYQVCGPVEDQPLQGGTHLIGDAEPPEPYSSLPGTSGWHAGGPVPEGVLEGPTDDPTIVSALEAGRVVLAHDGSVDPDIVAHLVEESDDRLVVAEYAGDLPTPVSLLAWGRLTRCDEVDFADVTSFVLEHAGRGPDNH